jgi:hypothetical protein
MKIEEIILIVQRVSMVPFTHMLKAKSGSKGTAINAKYVAILIMHEEGYKPDDIADVMQFGRTAVYWSLGRISSLIENDKEFKNMYLDCIKYIAEMEEEILCA